MWCVSRRAAHEVWEKLKSSTHTHTHKHMEEQRVGLKGKSPPGIKGSLDGSNTWWRPSNETEFHTAGLPQTHTQSIFSHKAGSRDQRQSFLTPVSDHLICCRCVVTGNTQLTLVSVLQRLPPIIVCSSSVLGHYGTHQNVVGGVKLQILTVIKKKM